MDLWQRGTTITRTNAANNTGRMVDRHQQSVTAGAAKSITTNRSTNLPSPLVFPAQYSLEIVNNTAIASFPAGEYIQSFVHFIEGSLFQPLYGRDFTVGCYVYSTIPGTFPISIVNGALTFSYVTTQAISAGWNYVSVVIPWSANITAIDNTAAIIIEMGCVSGTTFQVPTLNTWTSGNYVSHSSATNFFATASNTLRFAQFQVRSGQWTATEMQNSFQRTGITFLHEIQLCQRYYEKSYNLDVVPGTNTQQGMAAATSDANQSRFTGVSFKVAKRVPPTASNTWGQDGTSGVATNRANTAANVSIGALIGMGHSGFVGPDSGTGAGVNAILYHWAVESDF
jgi:hypothetical protein